VVSGAWRRQRFPHLSPHAYAVREHTLRATSSPARDLATSGNIANYQPRQAGLAVVVYGWLKDIFDVEHGRCRAWRGRRAANSLWWLIHHPSAYLPAWYEHFSSSSGGRLYRMLTPSYTF